MTIKIIISDSNECEILSFVAVVDLKICIYTLYI